MGIMMKCGCAAMGQLLSENSVRLDQPIPWCGIHRCSEQVPTPDLAGREARCQCGRTKPSDPDRLAFFEYRGPGSREVTETCECGYHKVAHEIPDRAARLKCKAFKVRGPREFDLFYCGCRGWE